MSLHLRTIKRRLKSISNTHQITKAMEMVSATKMRKSQSLALGARPFALAALELLENLSRQFDLKKHFVFQKRPLEKMMMVVVTSDKGLCGAYNSSLLKKLEEFLAEFRLSLDKSITFLPLGKKGLDYLKRRGYHIIQSLNGAGNYVHLKETQSLTQLIIDHFKKRRADYVYIAYTNFISTLKQESIIRQVLPLEPETLKEVIAGILPARGKFALKEEQTPAPKSFEYQFEPSAYQILKALVPALIEIQIHHSLLEANASEHSARMVAMKNASDNALELLEDLRLSYHKARQAMITKEIIEVMAGTL